MWRTLTRRDVSPSICWREVTEQTGEPLAADPGRRHRDQQQIRTGPTLLFPEHGIVHRRREVDEERRSPMSPGAVAAAEAVKLGPARPSKILVMREATGQHGATMH
jgi:hypothetical protein